jgi:hypothetical protein
MNEFPIRVRAIAGRSLARDFWSTGIGVVCLMVVAGCANGQSSEEMGISDSNRLTAAEAAEGWRLLFDGQDLSHWRGYRRETPPAGWSVQDGILTLVPGGERGDLMTREQFADFDLRVEWRISRGGNSGIIYRISEDAPQPWHTGPEMQVLDDDEHPDGRLGRDRNRTAGAMYDLIGPPPGVVRAVGEWNEARVIARGNRIEHWLNGHKIVDVELGSEEWNRLIAASKFDEMEGFGMQPEGHIALQDHGDPVWYRNIRIRPLH